MFSTISNKTIRKFYKHDFLGVLESINKPSYKKYLNNCYMLESLSIPVKNFEFLLYTPILLHTSLYSNKIIDLIKNSNHIGDIDESGKPTNDNTNSISKIKQENLDLIISNRESFKLKILTSNPLNESTKNNEQINKIKLINQMNSSSNNAHNTRRSKENTYIENKLANFNILNPILPVKTELNVFEKRAAQHNMTKSEFRIYLKQNGYNPTKKNNLLKKKKRQRQACLNHNPKIEDHIAKTDRIYDDRYD
jgi:hypothetical protein